MSIEWFDRDTLEKVIVDQIQTVDVVLDIGCGIRPQTFFEPKLSIFCEPYSKYVQILKNRFFGQHNVVILQGPWQETLKFLPNQSADSVFLLDVIEHLEKEDGRYLLKECERLARKQIVLFTPLGFMPQEYEIGQGDAWGLDGREYQVHKSGWTPEDFDSSWEIFGSQVYHTKDATVKTFDLPWGAFYAIRNIQKKKFLDLGLKLAIVSAILPPNTSDQYLFIYQLLHNFEPTNYCLLSIENYDPVRVFQTSTHRLPGHYHQLPRSFKWAKSNHQSKHLISQKFHLLREVFWRAIGIYLITKQEKCNAILAFARDWIDLPSTYLASRFARVPYYVYILDAHAYHWIQHHRRFFAERVETMVLRRARNTMVSNEFLKDEFQERYGIQSVILRNPYEPFPEDERGISWPVVPNEIKIVYIGTNYQEHHRALDDLATAIDLLAHEKVSLHLYTTQMPVNQNSFGPKTFYHPLSLSRVTEVCQQADILFLSDAFNSSMPEMGRFVSPMHMGQYMASGRPILVYAPSDSFVCWYFKKYKCGLIVGQSGPEGLKWAVDKLIDDEGLREHLCKNALRQAKADFGLETTINQFVKLVKPKQARLS